MIYLAEIDAYDPSLPGVRTLRYSSGTGYGTGYTVPRTLVTGGAGSSTPTLDSRVTISRATTGTCTGPTGLIETVAANKPRFDYLPVAARNLLVRSQEFAAGAWAKTAVTVVDADAAGPDGAPLAASTLTFSSGSGLLRQTVGAARVVSGSTYTFSMWARWVSGNTGLNVDINDGPATNITLTENWRRVSWTATAGAGSGGWLDFRSNGAAVFQVYGAQLEAGSVMTDYQAQTDGSPTAWELAGLLIEEGRTNLNRATGNLLPTGGGYFRSQNPGPHVTATAELAPNGVEYFAEVTRIDGDWRYNAAITAGGTYTGSVYCKRGNQAVAGFEVHLTGGTTVGRAVFYNFDTGVLTVSANSSGTVTKLQNGIVRLTLTVTDDGDGTNGFMLLATSGTVGVAGNSALYWGAMFEAGHYATSYVPATPTFTGRTSSATYYDSNGVLQSAAAGVARYSHFYAGGKWVLPGLMIEAGSTNLLARSARGGDIGGVAASREFFGGRAPDGTYSATLYRAVTTANFSVGQNFTGLTAGQVYSYSIHIKKVAGVWDWVRLRFSVSGGSAVMNVFHNITTGVTGTITPADGTEASTLRAAPPEPVGDGWWRLNFTFVMVTATAFSLNVGPATGNNVGAMAVGDQWLVWGGQLEQTERPTSYIPTPYTFASRTTSGTYFDSSGVLQTAASGVGRTTYVRVNGQWVLGGLLAEPAATNLILNSEDISAGTWSRMGSDTLSVNSVLAPTGAMTADRIIEGATQNSGHGLYANTTSITTGFHYTASIFAREAGVGGKRYLSIVFDTGGWGGYPAVCFDVLTGEAFVRGGGDSVIIGYGAQDLGGGWWRCWATSTASATATAGVQFRVTSDPLDRYGNQLGDGVSGLVLWGGMLESGNTMTSYHPSTGTAGTRAAESTTSASVSRAADTASHPTAARNTDVATVPVASFSFNTTEGTLLAEGSRPFVGGNNWPWLAGLDNGTSAERLGLVFDDAGTDVLYGFARSGGANQADTGSQPMAAGQVVRGALAYKLDDYQFAANGIARTVDNVATVPTGITTLRIGAGDGVWNGHVRRLAVFSTRLAAGDLATATVVGSSLAGPVLNLDFLSGQATTTVAISDGTYDLYVEGSGGGEWRSVTVSGGSTTITPPAGSATVTRYAFYTPAGSDPVPVYFDARIIEPGNFQRTVFSPGTTGGPSTVGVGELVLVNPDGQLDGLLDYGFDGRAVKVWTVASEAVPFSSAVRWMTATAQQAEVSWSRVTVRLRDRLELLRKPLQANTFAGTTTSGGLNSAEGQVEDLKGQPKPLLFGEGFNIPAVLANSYDLLYQIHDGGLASIDGVYDAGAPLAFSANYASLAALRAATVQGGYYATCLAAGLFKLGASPFGAVTCDATEGASAGARTAAQVARRIITRSALTDSDLDLATFTALDAKNGSQVGLWLSGETTPLEAASQVLNSIGGWLLPNRQGVFEVGRLEAPAAPVVATYTEQEILDRGAGIERLATRDSGGGVPVWKVTVRYRKASQVQAGTELAGCVSSVRKAELAAEWRTVTAENAAVKTKHLLATELTFDTLLTETADAQAEATRLLGLYSVRRDRLLVPVDTDLAAGIDLGRTVTVQVPRWGYGSGRMMTVMGLTESAARGVTDVEVWG